MLIFSIIIFYTVHYFVFSDAENTLRENSTSIAENVKMENGELRFNPANAPVAARSYFAVFDETGKLVYDNTDWDNVDTEPSSYNTTKMVEIDGEEWLLLDRYIKNDEKNVGTVRVMLSTAQIESTLRKLALLLLFAMPFYIAIAVAGSLLIVRSALKPINEITNAAREISTLDLTRRVQNVTTNDEVGKLSLTFNQMLERLEQAFIREKQFSADVSHELRTPVAVVMAQAEDALHGEKTPEQQADALKQIVVISKKMSKIISQMLTLTKSTNNQLILNKEPFDLTVTIDDIVSEMQHFASDYGVTIEYQQTEKVEIKADHMMLTQLLINLISNACKYNTIGGQVWVHTSTTRQAVRIVVRDNGVGMAADELPHIFDRFYRIEKAHSGDGSGLGLSIVKWIIEAHDGEINVESKLGEGTSIEVCFNLELIKQ